MLKKVKSCSLTLWPVLVTKVFYQRVISYVLFGNRDFKIQDATALRKRWLGKSLERGRRCKRGKFMLRFATRLGQYQYINPYKGFDEETKIGCLPKNAIITATLLGGRNYRRRRIFSALRGVCSTKSSISALGIREIFSRKQKFCRMQSWFSRR